MNKIMEKLNKLSLPAVILIASVILGGFYYTSQVSKQRSIERQQEIKVERTEPENTAQTAQDIMQEAKPKPTETIQNKQELQNCLAEANNWYKEAEQNTNEILEEEKKRYNPYQKFIDENATSRDEMTTLLLEELEDYKNECFKKYPQK